MSFIRDIFSVLNCHPYLRCFPNIDTKFGMWCKELKHSLICSYLSFMFVHFCSDMYVYIRMVLGHTKHLPLLLVRRKHTLNYREEHYSSTYHCIALIRWKST